MFKYLLLLLTLTFCIIINGGRADVFVETNPGCHQHSSTVNCSNPWLIHVLNTPSKNRNDSRYNHLWGGVGAPTLITAQTTKGSRLYIDWEEFANHQPDSVTFKPTEPLNVFGIAITELILFDDQHDQGTINGIPEDAQLVVPIDWFEWGYSVDPPNSRVALQKVSNSVTLSLFTVKFNGELMKEEQRILIKVTNTKTEGRAEEIPRLLTAPAASTVDLILDDLLLQLPNPHPSKGPGKTHHHEPVSPLSKFNSPRFAVRLLVFSSEAKQSSAIKHTTQRSLDDEYAPGIFQLDEVTTPEARSPSSSGGGFMQWRPIAYLTPKREVNKGTLPHLSKPCHYDNSTSLTADEDEDSDSWFSGEDFIDRLTDENSELTPLSNITESIRKSLAYAVFGEALVDMLAVETIVSFGSTNDGFYTSYDYTVWTFTVGIGSPPEEGLSTTVLVIILVGLGVPLLVLIVTLVGLLLKKFLTKGGSSKHDRLLEEQDQQS